MSCNEKCQCDCGNCCCVEQDVLEFTLIAANMGWNEEHSNLLIEFEKENTKWEDSTCFSKERHNARLLGYLHASEQTESRISEWMGRLEGWSLGKNS
jgi:hypothetical protein